MLTLEAWQRKSSVRRCRGGARAPCVQYCHVSSENETFPSRETLSFTKTNMKLRVRLNRQTSRLELPGEDPTLRDLVDQIRLTVLPSQGLSAETEFSLSLNGTEPLSNDGQTLSSCCIVSGDLICIILPEHVTAAPPASFSAVTEQTPSSATQHSAAMSSSQPSCSSPTTQKVFDDVPNGHSKALDPGQTGPNWEPMLCSEAEDGQAPLSLELLYHGASITSPSDAIVVAGNLLMLETGFTHQECELKSVDMPAGWRGAGGVYKLKYTHALCENCVAYLVAVCTGSTLVINATLKINETANAVRKLCLNPSNYVTNKWPDSAAIAFKDLKKLSRIFKDHLAYPLIAAAREAMALPVAFGLAALPPELLLRVLRLLDVHSVTRLSVVSKHFHNTTSDFTLWRHLFLRDFRDPDARNRSRDTNWKELYKRYFKIHSEHQQLRHHRSLPPYPSPRDIFGSVPIFEPLVPGIIGGEYDQRPALPRGLLPRPRHNPIGPFRHYSPKSGGRDRGFI